MCLEFSKVTTPGLDSLYDFYSFQIIPPMGKVNSFTFGYVKTISHAGDQLYVWFSGEILKWSFLGAGWWLGLLSVPGWEYQAVSSPRRICSDDQRCWIQVLIFFGIFEKLE